MAQTPKPPEMPQEAYERTLRARAFDISRYLLPLATNTSLGQIVNARTLETQISRLLGSPYEEVRLLGEQMKQAARGAAWDVNAGKRRALVEAIAAKDAALGEQAARRTVARDQSLSHAGKVCRAQRLRACHHDRSWRRRKPS